MIAFEVPGPVVGKGRPRAFRLGNGIRMHTPAKTASYENLVTMCASQAMAGRAPLAGPVEVRLSLYVSPPESWSKKKRAEALNGEIKPTTKPDVDNCIKAVADACNGVVWLDDKQITTVTVTKRYSVAPSAYVEVKPDAQ